MSQQVFVLWKILLISIMCIGSIKFIEKFILQMLEGLFPKN